MEGFIELKVLTSIYNVPSGTVDSGVNRFRNGKTENWLNVKDPDDARKVLISLDHIPNTTRVKYSIPTKTQYLEKDNKRNEALAKFFNKQCIEHLTHSYFEGFGDFHHLYWERLAYSKNKQTILSEQLAREHAYWVKMVDLTGTLEKAHYGKLKEYFGFHKKILQYGNIKFNSNVTSYARFKSKVTDLRNSLRNGNDGVDVLIDGNLKPKSKNLKVTDFHRALMLAYLQYEQIYSYRVVADLVNHHCELNGLKTISESSIKQIMSKDNKFRTLVESYRHGKKYFNDEILPHAVRNVTQFPANVWMIDGTPMQFFSLNESGTKTIRLYLFAIIDVCSRKIVGFDIGYSENRFNILKALKMAVMSEGYLPSEIVSDNFSAGKTEEILDLKDQMAKLGVSWRNSKVGNSQENSYIERFFGVFQSVECSLYEGYIGEGITSKRNNRPNAEFLQKMAKKKGLLMPKPMMSMIAQMIAKYNERSISGRVTPNEVVLRSPRPNAVEMDSVRTALMFWNKTSCTVKRGMVKIKINKEQHSFEIYDNETKLLLQNKKVAVRYDENDLDWVMLFDYDTDLPICECKTSIKVQLAAVDQDENEVLNIIKSEAKKKSYVKHIEQETNKILDKGLEQNSIKELALTHPLSLQKNQVNSKESKEFLELYHNQNGIYKEDEYDVEHAPIKTIKHSSLEDAHEQLLIKKSLVKGSLKPIN